MLRFASFIAYPKSHRQFHVGEIDPKLLLGLRPQCFMLIQRYPVYQCDRDAMEAAIRVCNLCDCLGSLNLPPDTCDPLRTADSMCWREIREIIVKNTPERVRCRHDSRLPFSSCIVRAPRKRPHLSFCRPGESPVESKKSIRGLARASTERHHRPRRRRWRRRRRGDPGRRDPLSRPRLPL